MENLFARMDYLSFYQGYLPEAKQHGEELIARCPFHEDHNPSMSISLKTGQYCCHACQVRGNAITFVAKMENMDNREAYRKLIERYGQQPARRSVAAAFPFGPVETIYNYTDENGELLYQSVRQDSVEDGKKQKRFFYRYQANTKNGTRWVNKKPADRVMYHLAEISRCAERGGVLFIVEGEKCAQRLIDEGYLATTTGGASSYGEWSEEYTDQIRNFDVIVLPDNDAPGLHYAQEISTKLQDKTRSLKLVELKELDTALAEKEDIFDYLVHGFTVQSVINAAAKQNSFTAPKAFVEDKKLLEFYLNDIGNCRRFLLLYGNDVRYNHELGCWYIWDGTRWKKDGNGDIVRMATEMVERFSILAKQEGEYATRRFSMTSGNVTRIKALVELAQCYSSIEQSELDQQEQLLTFPSATYDLQTGERTSHARENNITKAVSIEPTTPSACPTFLKFMDTTFAGDAALIAYVQRVLGYCLTGSTREQAFFVAYGTGANGKSTLTSLMSYIFHEFSQTIPSDILMHQEKKGGATPELARAKGARMVFASESSDTSRLNEAQIKQLTGGDIQAVRPLYSQGFEYKPQYKIWLSTNHKPIISGTDHSIWRRIHLIPFAVTVPQSRMDRDLPQKLRAEAAGIIAWLLEGARQWYLEGLNPPPIITEAVDEYRSDMDEFEDFIETNLERAPGKTISAKALYQTYQAYCDQNNLCCTSQTQFGRRIAEKGFTKKKSPYIHYQNLTIKQEPSCAAPLPTDSI